MFRLGQIVICIQSNMNSLIDQNRVELQVFYKTLYMLRNMCSSDTYEVVVINLKPVTQHGFDGDTQWTSGVLSN